MFYTMFSVDTSGFWEFFFFVLSLMENIRVVSAHFSFHLFIKAAKFNIQLSIRMPRLLTNIITIFEVIYDYSDAVFWWCYFQPISITFVNKYRISKPEKHIIYQSDSNIQMHFRKSFFLMVLLHDWTSANYIDGYAVQCSAAKEIIGSGTAKKKPEIEFYIRENFVFFLSFLDEMNAKRW